MNCMWGKKKQLGSLKRLIANLFELIVDKIFEEVVGISHTEGVSKIITMCNYYVLCNDVMSCFT